MTVSKPRTREVFLCLLVYASGRNHVKNKMTYDDFLKIFPEFSEFPKARVEFYLDEADNQISENRFGKSTEFGKALFTAHYLASLDNGQRTSAGGEASKGNISSGAHGAVASKTVGSVSVSYDTASTSFADAGYWNSTPYGKQFYDLLKRYRRMPFAVTGRASWP